MSFSDFCKNIQMISNAKFWLIGGRKMIVSIRLLWILSSYLLHVIHNDQG